MGKLDVVTSRALARPAEQVDEAGMRVHRAIFSDPELFELEMKHIFEGTWLYLAHETQIPKRNDFFTTVMGRQPVVVLRNKKGEINVLVNACSHRGNKICNTVYGNKSALTCSFHGWTYNTDGELLGMPKEEGAGDPECFDKRQLNLKRAPRVGIYRGFIFASLNPDAPALEDHLGGTKTIIDLMMDQSPTGWEVIKGYSTYTYDGNWKLQAENGVDGYHVQTTHANYVLTQMNRIKTNNPTRTMEAGKLGTLEAGFFAFDRGHTLLWSDWTNPQDRPNYKFYEIYKEKFGEVHAQWMVARLRNLLLYPNVFLMDQMSTQIRVFRPLAVDKTEVTIYCLAPVGEDAEDRNYRLRQYEDFFNASGMATPDDLAAFNRCQEGYNGSLAGWNDCSRGAKFLTPGSGRHARALGLDLHSCGGTLDDEGIFMAQHIEWLRLMSRT